MNVINKSTALKKSKISEVFDKLKEKKQKAFIPFVSCGYPDLDGYLKLVEALDKNGADIIEIGIPFSDPLADGHVIQTTSKIALGNGINTDIALDSIYTIRERSDIPVVILAYFNTIYRYGVERFLARAREVGTDGLIIPDLPFEEFCNYKPLFDRNYIDNIMLASLTSSVQRLSRISSVGKGFIYCVSVKGVTGIRDKVSSEVKDFLIKLRKMTDLPLALGFGLSNLKQIDEIKDYCDGVIVGSKILSLLLEATNFKDGLEKAKNFIVNINKVLKSPLIFPR